MSDRQIGPIAKELIAAKKRIEDPENWCPEGYGNEGRAGHRVCALLALKTDSELVCGTPAEIMLTKSAQELHPGFDADAIILVNALGHSAVMQMYDHAIAKAISEGK